jgi:hypothetical protein
MAALRAALLECATAERMKALGEKLYAAALAGDWTAAKLLLGYAIGKAPEAVEADRLDLDEWKLLDNSPTLAQLLRVHADTVLPKRALALIPVRDHDEEQTETLTGVLEKRAELRGGVNAFLRSPDVEAERQAHVGK